MLLGYNTNGFAFHPLPVAMEIIAAIGYRAIGITLDHYVLNPFGAEIASEIVTTRGQIERLGLRSVVETGARFLLDPWRKHQPTLVSPMERERQVRTDFLIRSIDIAAQLGSDAVSFWSGTPIDAANPDITYTRLRDSIRPLLDAADRQRMPLALEPEPGMSIDTLASANRLIDDLNHPLLKLTIDVGHLHCLSEGVVPDLLRSASSGLANIHIEDMRAGVHDHLFFGEGEMDFPPILRTLAEIGYANGIYVELSRHSHNAVETAQKAFAFLNRAAAQ